MGAVNLALQALNGNSGGGAHEGNPAEILGPNGGHPFDPMYNPERRDAPHNGELMPDGVIGLHNPRASMGVLKEQPWHRMVAVMLNNKVSNVDIAAAAGCTAAHISLLRGQRWFNELCVMLAKDTATVIKAKLDTYAMEAVEAIHEMATNTEVDSENRPLVPARVKLTAFTTLLEHSQGKPTQKVLSVSATTSFSSERDEYNAIMEELRGIAPLIPQPSGQTGPTT